MQCIGTQGRSSALGVRRRRLLCQSHRRWSSAALASWAKQCVPCTNPSILRTRDFWPNACTSSQIIARRHCLLLVLVPTSCAVRHRSLCTCFDPRCIAILDAREMVVQYAKVKCCTSMLHLVSCWSWMSEKLEERQWRLAELMEAVHQRPEMTAAICADGQHAGIPLGDEPGKGEGPLRCL